jgi:hypothetical protein
VDFKNSEKMMRKDVSGGGFQKFRKNDEKRLFSRWRTSKFKISEEMMRKDVSGGGF